MVSIDKLKSLLSKPERYTFMTLNYGATIGVALKGEKKVWLCGVIVPHEYRNDEGDWIGPEGYEIPSVSEEELAGHLNSL